MVPRAPGSRLGSSLLLPHPCQPAAFWTAAQSLTSESSAAAVPAAFRYRSVWATEFFIFWLVRKYCVMRGPGRKQASLKPLRLWCELRGRPPHLLKLLVGTVTRRRCCWACDERRSLLLTSACKPRPILTNLLSRVTNVLWCVLSA